MHLQNAKTKRESIGVELYGYQQSLAKLQLQLEQTHQNHQVINKIRMQVSCKGTLANATPQTITFPQRNRQESGILYAYHQMTAIVFLLGMNECPSL